MERPIHGVLVLFAVVLALSVVFISRFNNEAKAKECIEKSDKTDADICECLYLYSLTDTTLCQ